MKWDGRLQETAVGCVFAIEEGEGCSEMIFWDDITGEPLSWEGVVNARKEEMEEFRKHKVYKKVPIKQCWDETGKGPIGVRWIDINKGDADNPEYRSRLVAKEIKKDTREDLFAATPPLEAKKMLFSLAVTEGITSSLPPVAGSPQTDLPSCLSLSLSRLILICTPGCRHLPCLCRSI
jgi:hypothetical protein